MRHRFLFLVLALFCALVMPANAYAEDNTLVDSFSSGVSTWTEQSQTVEQSEGSNEIRLTATSEDTTVNAINSYLGSIHRFEFDGTTTVWRSQAFLFLRDQVVPIAVLLVFFWWGVRKALRVLMAAFRKGRASV